MSPRKIKIYIFASLCAMLLLGIYLVMQATASPVAITYILWLFTLGGVSYSWFYGDDEKKIKYANWARGAVALLVAVKMAYNCLHLGSPVITESLKALAYTGALSSFVANQVRDYYFISLLSWLFVLFSATISTIEPNIFSVYIICSGVLWMLFVRGLRLYEGFIPEAKEQVVLAKRQFLISQGIAIAKLSAVIVVGAMPLYFLIPRVNISFVPLIGFKTQESGIFIDMIGSGLNNFLDRNKDKAALDENKTEDKGAPEPSPDVQSREPESLIQLSSDERNPEFWHGLEAREGGLENAKSRQKDIENRIANNKTDLDNYKALVNRLGERIRQASEELAGLQPQEGSREEMREVLSRRRDMINNKIALEARIESSRQDLRSFEHLEASARQELQITDSPSRRAELEDRIKKFEHNISLQQEAIDKDRIGKVALENDILGNGNIIKDSIAISADKGRSEALTAELRRLEGDLQEAQLKSLLLEKDSDRLSQLYMYIIQEIAKEERKEEQADLRPEPEEEGKVSPKAKAPEEKPEEKQKHLFLENKEFFPGASGFALRLIYWMSLVSFIIVSGYSIYKAAKTFYLKLHHKNTLKRLLLSDPRHFVIGLYGYLLTLLEAYGYKRKPYLDTGEYSDFVRNKLQDIAEQFSGVSDKFQEARYSSHAISAEDARDFSDNFRFIIRRLSESASGRKRAYLRIKFPFRDI